MKRIKTLIIINPIAGTRSKKNIPDLFNTLLNTERFYYSVISTEYAGHAKEIAKKAINEKYDLIVAVGGDGTINEVAGPLIGTKVALGIIPIGSGNGLARHLKIPLQLNLAIEYLNKSDYTNIDTGKVNDHTFLCTTGIGFDARVSHGFSKKKTRGFLTYSKVVLENLRKAKLKKWKGSIDDEPFEKTGLLLTFANANQYGNNTFIAPKADIQDGLLDVCIIGEIRFFQVPTLIRKMFTQSLEQSSFYDSQTAKTIVIENEGEIEGHVDGEPVYFLNQIRVSIAPLSLKVFAQ